MEIFLQLFYFKNEVKQDVKYDADVMLIWCQI
jgi:hypothetical protein